MIGNTALARPLAYVLQGIAQTFAWRSRQTDKTILSAAKLAKPALRRDKDANVSLVQQMIAQGRVALLLRPQIATTLSFDDRELAQSALEDAMAIVPQGLVALHARCYEPSNDDTPSRGERLVNVEGFFLDRYTVTNRQYLEFVEDGGYEQMSLWDEAIWPAVLSFTDRSGQPGPRYWENGTFTEDKEGHPVVGVCWYEACAYSRWAGKRLPTDAEWVKVGTWPVFAESPKPVQRRFPWGDAMDRKRVNLWGSGHGTTVAVDSLESSASVNGVHQLVGNVWEWTSTPFGAWEPVHRRIETSMPLKSIRGGAFDTYFDTQAQCQFQSGAGLLDRKHNIGFRCALGFCDVAHMIDAEEPQPTEHVTSNTREEVLA
jgi:gamma-glutamyl hercynylcysteine S-oxide synthase